MGAVRACVARRTSLASRRGLGTSRWPTSRRSWTPSRCRQVLSNSDARKAVAVTSGIPRGAQLKLERARRHIQELADVIDAYHAKDPYVARLEHGDGEREYALRSYFAHEPPEELSVIIGDCLQNMRMSLEHVVWALAKQELGRDPGHTAFPICKTREDFERRSKKDLKHVPETARLVVGSLQPYRTGGEDPEGEPLWQLNEYANIDRHRQLSFIYSDSDIIEKASVGRRLEDGTFVPFERDDNVVTDLVISAGALVHGGELMSFKLKREVPNLDVEYSAPQSIDFGKEHISLGPAPDALNRMHEFIRVMLLPNLAPFFKIA